MEFAKHTCWDAPDWDGTLAEKGVCAGCDQAVQYPCSWCGYGHVFTTHNPEAHLENGDPVALAMGCDAWMERFCDVPYVEAA